MNAAETLANLRKFVAARPAPTPQPARSDEQIEAEIAQEDRAAERAFDRRWASERDMDVLAERRAG